MLDMVRSRSLSVDERSRPQVNRHRGQSATLTRTKGMFFGSIPALVTPFVGGSVAEDTFNALIEWQINEGSNALVPCGTTGEVPTLTPGEHRRLVELAVTQARGRVPVIAGCGNYSTA